jgi:hypothetical protein
LGHHERVRLALRVLGALTAALSAGVALVVTASPARAACGTVISFEFDASSGGVVLNPASVTVADGACVTLENNTVTSAEFTVGSQYKQTAPAFSPATPDYVAGPGGSTQPVTATGAAGTAKGTIVVKPAPQPSPSAPTSSPRPQPSRSRPAGSSPSPTSSRPGAVRPAPLTRTPTASPPPVQPLVSPPAGESPFLAGRPSPSPSPSRSAVAVVSGPLQPPTDRGTGLPAALAALAVVGTAGALLRVLLAEPLGPGRLEPVDGGHFVGPAL